MYLDFFGLKEFPFSIAPDPRYLYMSERHREALAHLLFGVGGQGGFVVLTGEVGTGKTTICRCFLGQVPETTDVAFVINPKLSAHELLASICDELKIEYGDGATIKTLNDEINRYLLTAHARGRHTVLVVDEAQNLSVDVLEQLRLLTNLETSEKKLLQIILLGQPELRSLLAQPELRQLAQRVTARYHLDALNRLEVGAYLKCRLAVAGRTSSVFTQGAIRKLYRLSGGIPRLINLIADRALLGAYASHSEFVDPVHVKQAFREIKGEQNMDPTWLRWAKLSALPVTAIVFSLGAWWMYQSFYSNIPLIDAVALAEQQSEAQAPSVQLPTRNNQVLAKASHVGDDERTSSLPRSASVSDGAQVSNDIDDSVNGENSEERYLEGFEEALGQSQNKTLVYREVATPAIDGTLDTLNSAAPASGQTDSSGSFQFLGNLTERADGPKSLFSAYQAVYRVWGVFYPEEPFMLACEFALLNDLKCLHKQGNWRSLLRLDRPVIMTLLNAQGDKLVIALLAVDGERAKVSHNGEIFWVTMDELDRHWLGEYSLIYQLPPYRSRTVEPGEVSEEQWLREQFKRVVERGLLPGFPDFSSRIPIRDIVEAFQKSVGLVPDGIAGSMTIIHLNTVLGDKTPRLLGQQSSTGRLGFSGEGQ